jgi:hypothetical protein
MSASVNSYIKDKNTCQETITFTPEIFIFIPLDEDKYKNQSTEGAEFVWVSECQKGEGCEIINQFVCIVSQMRFPVL